MESKTFSHPIKFATWASLWPVTGMVLPLLIVCICNPAVAATDFQLNFKPVLANTLLGRNTKFGNCGQTTPGLDCTIQGGNVPDGAGSTVGNDGTPFIQEELTINNTLYFHVVVGNPGSGFAIESYTRAALTSVSPNDDQSSTLTNIKISPFSQDSGGNEINVSTQALNRRGLTDKTTLFGNAQDPFGIGSVTSPVSAADSARISGNGTGDPSRTVMRMRLSDSQMIQEVDKPLLERKPLISQVTTDNTAMTSEFRADLRGLTYNQKDLPTPIINKLTLSLSGTDALPTDGAGDFDMTRVQRSTVTAGKYAYTAGSGWNTTDGWAHQTLDTSTGNLVHDATFGAGTYSGQGSGFNPTSVNWSDFFDPAQNPSCDPNSSINQTLPKGTNRIRFGVCPQ